MASKGGRKVQRPETSSRPMVVVRFHEQVDIPYEDGIEGRLDELKIGPWRRLEERFGKLALRRMFTALDPGAITDLQSRARRLDPEYQPARLTSFFIVDAPADADLPALVKALSSWPSVERAYLDIAGPDPFVDASDDPRAVNQGYLNASPQGVDARFAWTIAGGDGVGQRLVDLERGWTFAHEDLVDKAATLIHGSIRNESRGHGTSVLGELCAVDNTIGCVGIVPNLASVLATSYHGSTRPNAILAAIAAMEFGDVLLIEAQVTANPLAGDGLLGPIEVYDAEYETLRLASALGIIVVEAGGNGTNNGAAPPMAMDTWTDDSGRRLFWPDPGNPDFRDSGAIIVTAATSGTPRTRLAYGPHGLRIDCHAWGQNIDTSDSNTSGATNLYRTNFGGTSGASPMVAGAALAIQGIAQASHGLRFSPRQIRQILRDPALNTAPSPAETTAISLMPNLRRIIEDRLELVPDVYIRDFVGDTGDPHAGPISGSPDIILRPDAVADPQAAFGEGSGTENSATLGSTAEAGQPNFIYVRVRNRGGADAGNVGAEVLWSPVATLLTPDLWTAVGSTVIPSVIMGDQLTVSDAIVWPAAAIPGPGHYCFVGLIDTPGDPAPGPAEFLNFDNFRTFIRNNNNVTWRNFNVENNEPDPATGFVTLAFLAPGWPDARIRMRIEVEARLPRGARLFLEAPLLFLELAQAMTPYVKIDHKAGVGRLPLPPAGRFAFADMDFPAKARFKLRLLVEIPKKLRDRTYRLAARQMHGKEELGRVTWLLAPKRRRP
jgi:serine protease